MNLKLKLNELDIISMQEQVDEIVFNYIDTSANYEQAYKQIAPKLDEAMQFLQRYLEKNSLQVPPSNTYWTIFAGLVSKLAYFKAFTMWKLQHGSTEEMNRLFVASAYVLPNKETEASEEILEDIAVQYRIFQQQRNEQAIDLHEDALSQKLSTTECLAYIVKHLA